MLCSCPIVPQKWITRHRCCLWYTLPRVVPGPDEIGGSRFHLATDSRHPGPLVTRCTTLHLEACEVDEAAAQITCTYARPRPARPVRCAPPQRGASIVTTSAPSLICPGPTIGCASISCAQMVLPQSRLPPPHLHRTPAHGGGPLGAAHAAARPAPGRPRLGPGGQAGVQLGHALGPGGEPEHPPARAAPAASPVVPTPRCLGWMTSPCGNGTPMAPSWWTWSAASPSRSSGSRGRHVRAVARERTRAWR